MSNDLNTYILWLKGYKQGISLNNLGLQVIIIKMKISESIWILMASLVLIVSSSHSNNINSIPFRRPILRADMYVFKYEEGLKYEKNVKLSPEMLLHITNSLLVFATNVCQGVNKLLVGYFIKHFGMLIADKSFASSIPYYDMAYFGYENSIKSCLMSLPLFIIQTRNTKTQIPEIHGPKILKLNVAPITHEIDLDFWEDEDEDVDSKENDDYEGEEYLTDEEMDEDQMDQMDEDLYTICEKNISLCSEFAQYEDFNHLHSSSELSNKLKTLLQIMLYEFSELCPHHHKVYVQLWRKYYWGMLELFSEDSDLLHDMASHFHHDDFLNELLLCSPKRKTSLKDLLELDFEIGKIIPLA